MSRVFDVDDAVICGRQIWSSSASPQIAKPRLHCWFSLLVLCVSKFRALRFLWSGQRLLPRVETSLVDRGCIVMVGQHV